MAFINDHQVEKFEREGFCIIPSALSPDLLGRFRLEADSSILELKAAMEREDPGVEKLNQVPEHLFIPGYGDRLESPSEFLFGDLMVEGCKRFLGESAYLFIELFVCKSPLSDVEFEWHQDSGYLHNFGYKDYSPNLSVWLALDDVDESNGALWVIPFSEWPDRVVMPHEETKEGSLSARFPKAAKAISLPMEAGSLVFFSGVLPHRSGPNLTEYNRRAYLWQYSQQPILSGGRPIQRAVPFLRGGTRVFEGWGKA